MTSLFSRALPRSASLIRMLSVAVLAMLHGTNAAAFSPPPPPVWEPPAAVGKFPVGCTNVEQDLSKLKAGEAPVDYWEGNPGSTPRYVTDLFASPTNTVSWKVNVPTKAENDVFGRTGGTQVPYAAIVCYPTFENNTRANYALPAGRIPRMQRGDELPLVSFNPAADSNGRWPLIVMSHGLAGSPLGSDYVQVMERFAAEGYIVFAPFHADARFSLVKINNASDVLYVTTRYNEIVEMQAMRALGLKQGLDHLLSRVDFKGSIDTNRIVGFGASMGGMAMMLTQGARISTSLTSNATRMIVQDSRYKAVVGYVPFSGYSFQPAFGESNQGVSGIRAPYLGLGGTADVVAPISRTNQMVEALGGSKMFVTIEGMPHGLRAEDAPELLGWTFAFYKAQLSRDGGNNELFSYLQSFQGNADDRIRFKRLLSWPSINEIEVVQFVSRDTNKFFMSGDPAEIATLDAYPNLWQRTGQRFATFSPFSGLGDPMCRFWAVDNAARVNTHFYSTSASECAGLRAQPWARDEGIVMRALPVPENSATSKFTCPEGLVKVHRLYNLNSVNHMYLTENVLARSVFTADWVFEGPVFCAGKYED